jgi:hypothetical protein
MKKVLYFRLRENKSYTLGYKISYSDENVPVIGLSNQRNRKFYSLTSFVHRPIKKLNGPDPGLAVPHTCPHGPCLPKHAEDRVKLWAECSSVVPFLSQLSDEEIAIKNDFIKGSIEIFLQKKILHCDPSN